MTTSNYIVTFIITTLTLMAAEPSKLSNRPKEGELQRTFRASRDGFELLRLLIDQRVPTDLIFANFSDAEQSRPPYVATDPKYNTDPPMRPQHTSLKLNVISGKLSADLKVPAQMQWDELVAYNAWHGPSYTAYQGLTEAGFDPFAHNGEVAFRFDASKQARNQFADLLIVPDGWGSQIDSAVTWRLENRALFEAAILTKDELATLRTNARSSNTLIKKMASSLLMRHNAASAEDMKAWLRSEPSLVDVAVTVQLMLAHDPKASVVVAPAWMVPEGERVWGGALTGATLVFAQNQTAVTSMMHYHAKLREAKQVQSEEINTLKQVAKNQVGYDTIEVIGAELIRTNALRNYPIFSAANQILTATNIIDRALLFFE